jgi:hypothetical protein
VINQEFPKFPLQISREIHWELLGEGWPRIASDNLRHPRPCLRNPHGGQPPGPHEQLGYGQAVDPLSSMVAAPPSYKVS